MARCEPGCLEHDAYSEWSCETVRLARGVKALAEDLQWARAYIRESTGRTLEEIQAMEAKMAEVFGPHDGKLDP